MLIKEEYKDRLNCKKGLKTDCVSCSGVPISDILATKKGAACYVSIYISVLQVLKMLQVI